MRGRRAIMLPSMFEELRPSDRLSDAACGLEHAGARLVIGRELPLLSFLRATIRTPMFNEYDRLTTSLK